MNLLRYAVLLSTLSLSNLAAQTNIFPSQTNPAGANTSTIDQVICINWDGNHYSGLDATPYENAEWEAAPDHEKWSKMGRIGGKAPFDHNWIPTSNPDNLQEGDIGMSWAIRTLGYKDGGNVKMTFNIKSGTMHTVYGAWAEDPDSTQRVGYNGESYRSVDFANPSQSSWYPVSWGRENGYAYMMNKTGPEIMNDPTIKADEKGWIDPSFYPSDHLMWDQPNWMQMINSMLLQDGHEIVNATLDGMTANSGLPKSVWPNNGEGFDSNPNSGEQFKAWDSIGWNEGAGRSISKACWSGIVDMSESMFYDWLNMSNGSNLLGFKAPISTIKNSDAPQFLRDFNSEMFFALNSKGYLYDGSLTVDNHEGFDGSNGFWPFTLDNGCESIWYDKRDGKITSVDSLPAGLWEIPTSTMIVPASLRPAVWMNFKRIVDGELASGLINHNDTISFTEWVDDGAKLVASDVNLFVKWGLTRDQVLQILKYNLDMRISGNKAPFIINGNTDLYTPIYDYTTLRSDYNKNAYGLCLARNTYNTRIETIESFVDYALGENAKFKTHKTLIDYIKHLSTSMPATGDSSFYTPTWYFVKNSNLGSTTDSLVRKGLENVTMTIDDSSGVNMPKAAYKSVDAAGTFTGLTYISMAYNTEAPLAVKLHIEGDKPWQVLLNNIGPEVSSGRIPLHAFHYDPQNAGTESSLDNSKIIGVEVQPLTTGENREVVNFSITDFKIYGTAPYVSDSIAPENVQNLNILSTTSSTISASWDASVSTDVDSVLVAWSSDTITDIDSAKSCTYEVFANISSTHLIQNLIGSTTYHVKVFANDMHGNWNNGVEVKAITAPDDVTNFQITGSTTEELSLSWIASVSPIADTMLISWDEGEITDLADALSKQHTYLDETITSYDITSLTDDTKYFVKIFAKDTNDNWSDGVGDTASTEEINIYPPVSVRDSIITLEGSTSTTLSSGELSVLSNDADADGMEKVRARIETNPAYGIVTLNSDGTFRYIHDNSENFTDQFTYIANDGVHDGNVATVYITILPINDNIPVGVRDTIILDQGGVASVLKNGSNTVLNNDSDIDVDDSLTVSLLDSTDNGSLYLNANGTFIYQHDNSVKLSDQFIYTVTDKVGNSANTVVTIILNEVNIYPPVSVSDTIILSEGAASTTLLSSELSVLANDSDADRMDGVTARIVTNPAYGTIALNSDGTFRYVHDDSENFRDQFTYIANDGTQDGNIATVYINIVPVNDNTPVAMIDTIVLGQGGTVSILKSGSNSVLDNDSDVDTGDSLTVSLVDNTTSGSLNLNDDGTFIYQHDNSDILTDQFIYNITDKAGHTALGLVSILIDPVTDISQIGESDSAITTFTAAPNPATISDGEMIFFVPQNVYGEGEIMIYDMVNNLIDQKKISVRGNEIYRWDLKNEAGQYISSGTYVALLRVRKDDGNLLEMKLLIGVKE